MIEDYQRYYYLENRRKELKGKLSVFLNNFNVGNLIKIYDQNDNVIFEGRIGEVPQKIMNMASVIKGTATFKNEHMVIKVKKC